MLTAMANTDHQPPVNRRNRKQRLLLGLGLLSGVVGLIASVSAAFANGPAPSSGGDGNAVADPLFAQPYIDKDEWRDAPVRHRYVHGGFKGTDTRFSFYLPSKEAYQGRFFQYVTPVPDSENLSQGAKGEEDKIGFAISSGAYFIETNGGGHDALALPGSGIDPTIGAYRANAAAARYSRTVAQQMYGAARPFGYIFGGSGGAFRTIGSFENTDGVWDGAVPYVMGSPMAIPGVFTARMHAMRILQDKFPQIVDAIDAGGSGDMYAGLTTEQRDALVEVTRMGFPPQSWYAYKTMGVHAFTSLYPNVVKADPGYFRDFWTKPGYLGANPPESLLKARIQFSSTVVASITAEDADRTGFEYEHMPQGGRGQAGSAWQALLGTDPKRLVAFKLSSTPPDVGFLGGDLVIKSGTAAGKQVQLRQIVGDKVVLGMADAAVLALIKPDDQVEIDNSNFLAAQTYHRHQVPGADYPVWDQFRDPAGKPIYPQRPMLLGPIFTKAASGTIPTGRFKGKMIVVESLWDREAYPWQADWYRSKIKENLGADADQNFRLWYMDHALHGDLMAQEAPTRTISYIGALHQALRDLSDWVEHGVAPPESTNYKVVDGQVAIPPSAGERAGIQPVVSVTANGSERAEVAPGQSVTFVAKVGIPPRAGRIVAAAWDFDGKGTYPVPADLAKAQSCGNELQITVTHRFSQPGTYFPVLRAVLQRQGDRRTNYGRIQNLGRVRVVVK
jgi:hypothetical protein